MKARVVLLVPIKPLSRAKTRLRASAPSGGRSLAEHMDLVLAMAVDTVVAARGAAGVAGVAAITSDRRVITAMTELGVETILEPGQLGLNDALDLGSRTVRATRPEVQIGALNADLPSFARLSCRQHFASRQADTPSAATARAPGPHSSSQEGARTLIRGSARGQPPPTSHPAQPSCPGLGRVCAVMSTPRAISLLHRASGSAHRLGGGSRP